MLIFSPTAKMLAALLMGFAVVAGCSAVRDAREPDQSDSASTLRRAGIAHVVVSEAFITPATPFDDIDSPALWVDRNGEALLLATAKKTGRLKTYDGDTGVPGPDHGTRGAAAGQFDRPNGIFVVDDRVFVVERDNHRIQVLRLPDFKALGSFGEGDLDQPTALVAYDCTRSL